MAFEIRDVRTNALLVEYSYTTFSSANRSFRSRLLTPEIAYIGDTEWRARELNRPKLINLAEFGLIPIPDHFLHVSSKSTDAELLVSYTVDEFKGMKNLQASGRKIGRYLVEFYPEMNVSTVANFAAAITSKMLEMQVTIVMERDKIRDAYICSYTSPQAVSACMSYGSSHYKTHPIHPTEAYGAGDLGLAYTVNHLGEMNARAIVWPEKKIYGRLYGTGAAKLEATLIAMGYKSGKMKGARLLKIEIPYLSVKKNIESFAVPYLDESRSVLMTDDYLIIADEYDSNAKTSTQYGYISWEYYTSIISGKRISSTDLVTISHPETGTNVYLSVEEYRDPQNVYVEETGYFAGYKFARSPELEKYYGSIFGSNEKRPAYVLRDQGYVQAMDTNVFHKRNTLMEVLGGYVTKQTFFMQYSICEISRGYYKRSEMTWMEHGAYWHPDYIRDGAVMIDNKWYPKEIAPSPFR